MKMWKGMEWYAMTLWKVQKLYSENEIRYSVLPYSVKGFMMDIRHIKRWKYTFSFFA